MEPIAFTPREACEVLRCGRTKLYKLLGTGELRAVRLGRNTLILREDLERFVRQLTPAALSSSSQTRSKP